MAVYQGVVVYQERSPVSSIIDDKREKGIDLF